MAITSNLGTILLIIILISILFVTAFHIFIIRKIKLIHIASLGMALFAFIIMLLDIYKGDNGKALRGVVAAIWFIYLLAAAFLMVLDVIKKESINKEVHSHIKNDKYDVYFTMDSTGHIIDYSSSIVTITRLTKKEIMNRPGWPFIFDNFKISKLNGESFIVSNATYFLNHLDESIERGELYRFDMDVKLYNEEEDTHYLGIIQTHYLGNYKIGSSVYLYKDRAKALNEVITKLNEASNLLFNHKNVLYILMSLSEGIALYYDYQEKLYFATQAFKNYVGRDIDSYNYQDFYQMIVEEDRNLYTEQSNTINPINVTRIKYRMQINNVIYNAIEDSIILSKDTNELVSIVHITSRADSEIGNEILSTKEAVDLMNKLANNPIKDKVDNFDHKLNEVLTEDED